MSHSLSLDVMEMAEAAALLDRLASGLDEFPRRSAVPSSSASDRTDPPERTCCWSLDTITTVINTPGQRPQSTYMVRSLSQFKSIQLNSILFISLFTITVSKGLTGKYL